MSVGMALAEAHLAATYNRGDFKVIYHYTYSICGDGDIMEGITGEAASLAAHLKLGKLIMLYDSNDISLDGDLSMSFSENVQKRFEGYGWHVQLVKDGNDLQTIQDAIAAAQADPRPSLIEVKTTIGYGSPNNGDEVTSVGKELEHISAFLSLEQLRKPLSIDIFYDVPKDLLPIPMLKLVLQPIVENVLLHGKSEDAKCKIMITCRQKGEMLEFSVMDNGPGLPSYLMEAPLDELIQRNKVGVGISNVHERIKIVYGSQCGLTLKNREQKGSKVEIRFPVYYPGHRPAELLSENNLFSSH
jgi:hypothetical protein